MRPKASWLTRSVVLRGLFATPQPMSWEILGGGEEEMVLSMEAYEGKRVRLALTPNVRERTFVVIWNRGSRFSFTLLWSVVQISSPRFDRLF